MSTWQPIETAPKDGSLVLLCSTGGAVWCGHWLDSDQHPYGRPGWTRFNCVDIGWEPENWMPLPAPPTHAPAAHGGDVVGWRERVRGSHGPWVFSKTPANHPEVESQPLYTAPQQARAVDVERMLSACVPGGTIVDPQAIADNLRAWFAASPEPPTAADSRRCTCHPDDSPPRPCAKQYALHECRDAAKRAAQEGTP